MCVTVPKFYHILFPLSLTVKNSEDSCNRPKEEGDCSTRAVIAIVLKKVLESSVLREKQQSDMYLTYRKNVPGFSYSDCLK